MLVETCVGRLFVETHGDGAPVLLWHSLLCEGSMWRFQVPALAERYRVINVDGPGHGRSAHVTQPFTLEDCAHAGIEVLDALSIDSAHWVGLSWGGMTGMRAALAYPSRLRSLALLDTSAAREARRKLPSYHAMAFVARRLGAVPLLLDRLEPIFFAAATLRNRRDVVDRFRDQLSAMDPTSIGHAVDAVIFRRGDIRPRLSSLKLPTLVIVGDEDVATPPARAREIGSAIEGARIVEIPGAGHLSTLDCPERLTEELLSHLHRL